MKTAVVGLLILLLQSCGQKDSPSGNGSGRSSVPELSLAARVQQPGPQTVRPKLLGHHVVVNLPKQFVTEDGQAAAAWPRNHFDPGYVRAAKVLESNARGIATRMAARPILRVMRFVSDHELDHHQKSLLHALLETLPAGLSREQAKFTYVVRNDSDQPQLIIRHAVGRMSEKLEDTFSKHLLLNRFGKYVLMAGEITLTADNEVVFDYDSGTYKPDEQSLKAFERVLSQTFQRDVIRTQTIAEKKAKSAAPAEEAEPSHEFDPTLAAEMLDYIRQHAGQASAPPVSLPAFSYYPRTTAP